MSINRAKLPYDRKSVIDKSSGPMANECGLPVSFSPPGCPPKKQNVSAVEKFVLQYYGLPFLQQNRQRSKGWERSKRTKWRRHTTTYASAVDKLQAGGEVYVNPTDSSTVAVISTVHARLVYALNPLPQNSSPKRDNHQGISDSRDETSHFSRRKSLPYIRIGSVWAR